MEGSGSVQIITDPDADPGGPKTCGSGFGTMGLGLSLPLSHWGEWGIYKLFLSIVGVLEEGGGGSQHPVGWTGWMNA
jgi:hypothetical protein